MERLGIRSASLDDAPAIGRIHAETWQDTYAGLLPDKYLISLKPSNKAADWSRILARPERRADTLVAVVDNLPVGFVSVGGARTQSRTSDGEIYAIYVATDWQGQGIGRALLTRGLLRLAKRGSRAAVVWVLAGNPARFFYEAMGASPWGSRVDKFAGAAIDELGYRWPNLNAALSRLRRS